jgi:hypothetical protein
MKKQSRTGPTQLSFTKRLFLAGEGALIAVALSTEATRATKAKSRQALLSMLTLKTADHLRLAGTALSEGHYYSAPILLRSALDSIGVLCITSREEKELKKWVFLTYVSTIEKGLDAIRLREMRSDFYARARTAYDGLLSSDSHVQPVRQLIWDFNVHVHPGLEGLLEIVDFPLELDELLGVEVRKVLDIAQGDLDRAIELLGLVNKKSKPRKRPAPSAPAGAGQPAQYGTFNEDVLDSYSGVLHAATHHLVELSAFIFKDSAPASVMQAAAEWNARSQAQFKAYKKR